MRRPKTGSGADVPPTELRARGFEHDGEQLVVFSFPVSDAGPGSLASSLADALTAAQQEVVALALTGRSNREIAELRGTAVATVAKQLEQIYRRLGINSRRELAALAGRFRSEPRPPE